jgi:hypothetical protein
MQHETAWDLPGRQGSRRVKYSRRCSRAFSSQPVTADDSENAANKAKSERDLIQSIRITL